VVPGGRETLAGQHEAALRQLARRSDAVPATGCATGVTEGTEAISPALVQVARAECFLQELQLLVDWHTLKLVESLCALQLVYC
jgi:hypothetical protein